MNATRLHRFLDLSVLLLAAVVWVPAFLICALAVAIGSGRPIFFRQERVGLHGRRFDVLKFRSMHVGAGLRAPDAHSVTRVGAFLRRTSLDELPQLLNVLLGQMSLVGPRPMLPNQVAALDAVQHLRHQVRPGLTGLAQVRGRNSIPWAERLHHDVEWALRPTFARWGHVVLRTLVVVPTGSGATGDDASDPFVRLVFDVEPALELDRDADVRPTIELDDREWLRA